MGTKRILDYNPLTGERVVFQYDHHADQMTITHEQDVSSILKDAHERAISTDYTRKGMKDELLHYARVPNSVILEMKQKHGVDFFDRSQSRKMFALLNTEYKQFKTTEKTHNVK